MTPPPLPMGPDVETWNTAAETAVLVEKAKNAMAVAWGESQLAAESQAELPYVPLLSALEERDFKSFIGECTRQVFDEDGIIVEQNAPGDALYIIADGQVAIERAQSDGEHQELARLGAGAFFGEMAIVSSARRAARVRALERTVVLRGDKDDMDALAGRLPDIGNVLVAFCHARMLENLMRASPVLAPLPVPSRPDVIALFDTDYYEAGQGIIEEGQQGPGLFLIASGRVRVSKLEDDEQVHIAELGPGDVFGEISLLMQRPSTASVSAIENTAVLFLSGEDFLKVTSQYPELLKGAFDIALEREKKNNSILASSAAAADDLVLV